MDNISEKLFANLCSSKYLHGFVFHSPKYYDPTEKEAGDVIVWVRTQLLVFEIVWREPGHSDTRSFVKRIGEKRDQLLKDFEAFQKDKNMHFFNELGKKVEYIPDYFVPENFFGIVIIDCDEPINKLHYGTIEKSIKLPFSNAILNKKDFISILYEFDTSSDLKFYLRDRFHFLKQNFKVKANYFLDLNEEFERQLIAFYKMNNYEFTDQFWIDIKEKDLWIEYTTDYSDKIIARNKENEKSLIIDNIIELLLEKSSYEIPTTLIAAELAVLTRRARAIIITDKIADAFYRMKKGNEKRYFAFMNWKY